MKFVLSLTLGTVVCLSTGFRLSITVRRSESCYSSRSRSPIPYLKRCQPTYGAKNMYSTESLAPFLNRIHTIPLLSADEEIQLSKLIQKSMRIKETHALLAKKLQRPPTLSELAAFGDYGTPEQINKIMKEGLEARTKMVNSNLRLVQRYLNQVSRRENRLNRADLMQEGILGLIRAAEKYEARRGRFSTYATIWIRSTMGRPARQKRDNSISVPSRVLNLKNSIDKYKSENPGHYGLTRVFTSEELAAAVGATVDQVDRCLNNAYIQENSVDIYEDPAARRIPEPNAEGSMALEELRTELKRYLKPEEWGAVVLRYGLSDHLAPCTIVQVAEMMNMNTGATSKHIKSAVSKLQIESIRAELIPYLTDFAKQM